MTHEDGHHDDSVEVAIRKQGAEIAILDKKTHHEIRLSAGEYKTQLKRSGAGLVLEDLEGSIEGELVESRAEGRVRLARGARVERSVIRGPVIIGEDARIVDAYVGPYTSIERGVEIARSEVEHSILLAGSRVHDLESRLEASLLGRNVTLRRGETMPRTLSMIVGDNADIVLP